MLVIFTTMFVITTMQRIMVNPQDRIIGGTTTSIYKHPYLLSLHYRGLFQCGAVLISRSSALTGAHCVLKQQNLYYVRAGSSLTYFRGFTMSVAHIIKHPLYKIHSNDYDIAVLILFLPLPYEENIMPIQLPQTLENPADGAKAIVTGWGTTNPAIPFKSMILKEVEVAITNQKLCEKTYGSSELTDRMLCAGYNQGGKDACQGDSGGPLVSNNKLVGIVSWGYGCGLPTYPGVYTRIPEPQIRLFIRKYSGV